jgi:serine/threonine protein kinase/Flp pilus assembly protein TadD
MDLPAPKQRTISLKPDDTVSVSAERPPGPSNGDADAPSDKLVQEFRGLWAKGEQLTAAEFFSRHAKLPDDPDTALDLIYEEICLREGAGQEGVWEEVVQRFPQWRGQLQALRDCHRLLQPAASPPRFPEVGETLGEFRLLAELGRGARGRVYLATQPALAGRPVVLKVTPRLGDEHISLARLQHTNIMPLYAARDERTRQIRILCMPYLGNATLARLLEALAGVPFDQRSGQDVLGALERLQQTTPLPLAPVAAARQFLARASYVQTLCWIGACCADALQYAHERGLVHLDLKPSNVLLAADGQPMLLDFHLAHKPVRPDDAPPDELGGTIAYMPPEQRAAMEAVGEGRGVPAAVDGRADLYSLGAVLYEALGGPVPFQPGKAPPLARFNPQVSAGLSDIISKCLEAEPRRRYADAASLADDLRRHLRNQPLKGVANRDLAERWRKWRQRRPNALRWALLGVILAGLIATFAAGLRVYLAERAAEGERALQEGPRQWQRLQAYDEALATLQHGLARVEHLPFQGELAQRLREEIRQAEAAQAVARRQQLIQQLHEHVKQLSLVAGIEGVSPVRLRGLEATARALWEKRELIRERLGTNHDLDHDLLDLAICWTDLSVRLAGAEQVSGARRRALEVLSEAEKLAGPQAILDQERLAYQRALGLPVSTPALAAEPAAGSVWERNALGRLLLREGQIERACDTLKQACAIEPHNAWSNYYYGVCAYRLGRYEEATLAFSVCIGAAPELAGCYYSRGLAQAALKRTAKALHDYDRALQLDATLASAWVNRGMLHYQEGRHEQALADLAQGLKQGADAGTVYYDEALVYVARREPSVALSCLARALQHNPDHDAARRLRDQLR